MPIKPENRGLYLGGSPISKEEPKYFDIACERITKAYDQPDMFVEAPKKAEQGKIDV